MNQFATPGLGSLMGKRILPGLGQLFLALAGFALVLVWFGLTMKEYYGLMSEDAPAISFTYTRYLLAGVLLFAVAWLWSLLTSLSLMRQAKIPEPPPPGSIPPRITKPPGKM
jgi:membrane protease YdiL (CAAX protease family)